MNLSKIKIVVIVFSIMLFVLNSCEKPNTGTPDSQSSQDNAKGAYVVTDIFALANNHSGKALNEDECFVFDSIAPGNFSITFDSCDYRGALRDGKVTVKFERLHPNVPKATNLTITFDNYYVDGNKVEGKITTTVDISDVEHPAYTVVASDMKLTSDSATISWNSTKTHTMIAGFMTPAREDNEFSVSGTSSGVNRNGKAFSTVYDGVIVKNACEHPVEGKITLTSDAKATIIDFGNGECDDLATITMNGVSLEIHLK